MPGINSVCVYCGSSFGADPRYRETAQELGQALAANGIDLVFGGGRVGLMGTIADAVLAGGGRVTGIIPESLRRTEVPHTGLTELIIVPTMHDRKRLMAERADAFAVLPGGIGTLDEMFEIVTWRQLRLHDKPIFVVDGGGYWAPLRALLDHLAVQGFVQPLVPRLLEIVAGVPELIAAIGVARAADPAGQHLRVS